MKNQKGQILLIMVMLIATVITVVMTMVYKTTTETQITKLEQESQKALVAAEAAVEKALKANIPVDSPSTYNDLGLANLIGIDLEQSTVSLSQADSADFVTPLLQKDQSYSFYLADPSDDFTSFSNYWYGQLTFYLGSETITNCSARDVPALELTLIYGALNSIKRFVIEPCSSGLTIENADLTSFSPGSSFVFSGTTFRYKTTDNIVDINLATYPQPKILFIKSFFGATKIGFHGTASLRPQGNILESTAKAYSGVEKRIQLFQSYPQIPAEFFTTSF